MIKKILTFFIMVLILWHDDVSQAVYYMDAPTKTSVYETVKTLKLTLTGYYKALPDQPEYATGTYEGDLARNGTGEETSSGTKPTRSTLATDPDVIPTGSLVRIIKGPKVVNELKGRILNAKDTGGSIVGNKADSYTGEGYKALLRAKKINGQVVTVEVVKKVEKSYVQRTYLWG